MRGETQRVAERVRELLDPARTDDAAAHERSRHLSWLDAEGGAGGDSAAERSAAERSAAEHGPADHPADGDELDLSPPTLGRSFASPTFVQRLAARVPVRLDPGHRAAAGVGAAVIVVAIVAGFWLWVSGPRSADVAAAPTPIAGASSPAGTALPSAAASSPGAAVPSAAAPPSQVVVDVAGKVARPGVYELPTGARIADALAAAGGARAGVDLTPINLAARVADGQQIVVGVPGAAGQQPGPSPGTAVTGTSVTGTSGTGTVSGSAGAGSSGGGGAVVNINSASLDQLETLPGIGPALGQRILDYRTAHGPFTSVDQLNDVSGIGDVKFAGLKDLVTV